MNSLGNQFRQSINIKSDGVLWGQVAVGVLEVTGGALEVAFICRLAPVMKANLATGTLITGIMQQAAFNIANGLILIVDGLYGVPRQPLDLFRDFAEGFRYSFKR